MSAALSRAAIAAILLGTALVIWSSYRMVIGVTSTVATAALAPLLPEHIDVGYGPISADRMDGAAKARLLVVEFVDFECPFCSRYSHDTSDRLRREYIDSGKVRYTLFHYPLDNIHPHALGAGEIAECAREQGLGYLWAMRERLFASQRALAQFDVSYHARQVGLNLPLMNACVTQGRIERIRDDQREGRKLGVSGTPTILLGLLQPDNRVHFNTVFRGAVTFDTLDSVIRTALREIERQ